jgi:intracellular sulfur oxidation DsrE/DsrF family protein
MNKRPRLEEAIKALNTLALISDEAVQAIADYADMREQGMHFQACRMVVDIIDQHNKQLSNKRAANV